MATSIAKSFQQEEERLQFLNEQIALTDGKLEEKISELENQTKEKTIQLNKIESQVSLFEARIPILEKDIDSLLEKKTIVLKEMQELESKLDSKRAEANYIIGENSKQLQLKLSLQGESNDLRTDIVNKKGILNKLSAEIKEKEVESKKLDEVNAKKLVILDDREKSIITRENAVNSEFGRMKNNEQLFEIKTQELKDREKNIAFKEKDLEKLASRLDNERFNLEVQASSLVNPKLDEWQAELEKKDKEYQEKNADLLKREKIFLSKLEEVEAREKIVRIREKRANYAE